MRHIELNNEVTQLNEKGFFRLEKDKEAVAEFLESEINPKLIRFDSIEQRYTYRHI